MTEPLMTADEAKDLLHVSRGWVYKQAKAGHLPHRRLGGPDGPLRFVRSELEDYVENARQGWKPSASTLKPG